MIVGPLQDGRGIGVPSAGEADTQAPSD